MAILILGAGGLAREAFAALRSAGVDVAGFRVEAGYPTGMLCGLPVSDDLALEPGDSLVIAIGDERARVRLATRFEGAHWATVRHPAAVLGPNVSLGEGSMILGPCSATIDVTIGAHALINPGCTLAHDCSVAAFASLGPSVALAGGVVVGEGARIGTGARIAPRLRVGAWSTVGAGAVVIGDVAAGDTVVGVPARSLRATRS